MKKIKEILGVKSYGSFQNDLYIIKANKVAEKLDYRLNKVPMAFSELYSINIESHYLVDYGLKILDLNNNKIVVNLNEGYSPLKFIDSKNLLCKKINEDKETVEYFLFNLITKNFSKLEDFIGNPIDIRDNKVITRKKNILVYSMEPFIKIWEFDLGKYGDIEGWNGLEKGKISEVFIDKSKVYILSGLSIIALSIKDGKVIWHTQLLTYQSFGVLEDGFLYTSSNSYINKVNVETGEIIYEEKIESVNIHGEEKLMPISKYIWRNGYLWAIMDTSPNALLKINSKDGSFSEVFLLNTLEITKHCHPPKFLKDRMYILDLDDTLHIFENLDNNTEAKLNNYV